MPYKMNCLGLAGIFLTAALIVPNPSAAQERYPAVARLSFVSGPVSYSRGDDPGEWDEAIENIPLTIGDRLYTPAEGRAEMQISSGNFIRLAPRSYLSTLNLSDDVKQFYLGEGIAFLNIRRLAPDELIEIDTPNVSVTLEEPGRYRIAVDENGDSRISVRRGRVSVAAGGKQIAVENSEIRVYGLDAPRYEIVGLSAEDGFDRWAAERDDRFERDYRGASQYASEDIIGVEELSQYGRWESIPEYGHAWTPANVAAGWVPFTVGRWYWQDPWGWNWISGERWGWATSHYGRWVPYRGRWYWVPVRRGTRVRYIPACVEFVRVRDHVGWFPLHPRDRFIPWWERRDRRHIDPRITYVNHNHVTIVNHNVFISARPVHRHILRDRVIVHEFVSARPAPDSFPVPSRSSLRIVSESGERRIQRPPATLQTRAAVVRTAPPAPLPTFEEKFPEIQKRQGRPIDPKTFQSWASRQDRTRAWHTAIRPAAEPASGFAPRTPQAAAGIVPQPVTAARGKRLATKEDAVAVKLTEKAERPEAVSGQQTPRKPAPEESGKDTARRSEPPPQPLRQEPRQKPSREQLRLEELERQQAQKEAERKAQQARQEGARQEQLRQQQLQERQAQQQKQQELERRQREQERALERQAQQQQRQQEQQRREQLRQQQMQEQQALHQQKQQELERKHAERRAQHEQNQARIQQQRQERQAQPQQKQPRRQPPEAQRESERKSQAPARPQTQP
jgi:hypothetical protein